ncbi:DUF11 domain-containing protein, partial [bacterium]|nr:DUF11 domain-containing protein [bacterium]
TYTQAFPFYGADPDAAERKRLLQRAISWIMCGFCADASMSILCDPAPIQGVVGEELTYGVRVMHGGECRALGVQVVNVLPPGVQFVRAVHQRGSYSHHNGVVTFSLGRFESSQTEDLELVVRPLLPGALTNVFTVTAPGIRGETIHTITELTGTPLTLGLSIGRGPAANALELIVLAPAGFTVYVEESTSVGAGDWTILEAIPPNGQATKVVVPVSPTFGARFYRARLGL